MANLPKAIQLLNLLDDKELEHLKKNLARDKRLRLLMLTENLIKLKNHSFTLKEKKILHKKLFAETYTSPKDYLLRNEFRLLAQQIEHLLVEEEIKKEIENNNTTFHYYLLKALQERQALDLFQREYPASYEMALAHHDYYSAYNITGLNFINFTHFLNLKEKDLPYLEKLNELKLTHLSCYYLSAFRQNQIDEQFIHDSFLPFSTEGSPLEKEVEVDFQPFETDYSSYLFLKAKSYLDPLPKRVATLQQCLRLAEHHLVSNESLFQSEVTFCLSALARTHSLLAKFTEANRYFENLFTKIDDPRDWERLTAMGDYIANLINLNEIDQAITLLEENILYIEAVPRLLLRYQCLQVACYAFKEETEKLGNALPEFSGWHTIETKYFFRFYFAIHAYLDHQPEAAYREMENLRHLTSSKEEMAIHPVVNFFHRYFYTIVHHPFQDETYTKNLEHLTADVEAFAATAAPAIRSYLPFAWLRRKLREM